MFATFQEQSGRGGAANRPEESGAAAGASFAQQRLWVVCRDSIPTDPAGKLQRAGLAERLGIPPIDEKTAHGDHAYFAPRTPVEQRLQKIWQIILGLERVGVYDRFLAIGGDSVLAVRLANRVSRDFEQTVTPRALFEPGTIAEMAAVLEAASKRRG